MNLTTLSAFYCTNPSSLTICIRTRRLASGGRSHPEGVRKARILRQHAGEDGVAVSQAGAWRAGLRMGRGRGMRMLRTAKRSGWSSDSLERPTKMPVSDELTGMGRKACL